MTKVLVTGATGTIGGEVARQLSAAGNPVRLLVRDRFRAPQLPGPVEVFEGDFDAPRSLEAAVSGAERLFLASYDRPDVVRQQANVLAAARSADAKHVVRMSSDGIEGYQHLPIFQWHLACERQLEDSGLAFTHLKPVWVMQNFDSFVVDNRIRLPAGDGRIGLVDARDIAAIAVAALTQAGHDGKAYRLSAESLTHQEIAQELSLASNRIVVYEDLPPDTYRLEKSAAGWPAESLDTMLELFDSIRAETNYDRNASDTILPILNRPAITFREFAREWAARLD
jgi:uncharacterized protein YbjT (DUF2867 family)